MKLILPLIVILMVLSSTVAKSLDRPFEAGNAIILNGPDAEEVISQGNIQHTTHSSNTDLGTDPQSTFTRYELLIMFNDSVYMCVHSKLDQKWIDGSYSLNISNYCTTEDN